MKAGELFVELTIKGGDKSAQQINAVVKGLGQAKEAALETKAAILAVIVAIEKMVAGPAKIGADYAQFQAYTGLDIKPLQQMQYALHETGAAFESTKATLLTFFDDYNNQAAAIQAAPGLNQLSNMAARIGLNFSAAGKDVYKTMDALAAVMSSDSFTRAEKSMVANTLKVPYDIQAAMLSKDYKGLYSTGVPDLVSGKQARSLQGANAHIENVGRHLQMVLKDLVSREGDHFIKQLDGIITRLSDLIVQFDVLADKLHIFDSLNEVLKMVGENFEGTFKFLSEAMKLPQSKSLGEAAGHIGEMIKNNPAFMVPKAIGKALLHHTEIGKDILKANPKDLKGLLNVPIRNHPEGAKGNGVSQNNTVTQTIHVASSSDSAADIADAIKQETVSAYRQFSAQLQKA